MCIMMRQYKTPTTEQIEKMKKELPYVKVHPMTYCQDCYPIDGFKMLEHTYSNYDKEREIISMRAEPYYNRYNNEDYFIKSEYSFFEARHTTTVSISKDLHNMQVKAFPYDELGFLFMYKFPESQLSRLVIYVTIENLIAAVVDNKTKDLASTFGLEDDFVKDEKSLEYDWRKAYNRTIAKYQFPDMLGRRIELTIPEQYNRFDLELSQYLEKSYNKLAVLVEEKK